MLIKTQDGDYIKWEVISALVISDTEYGMDGYDLAAVVGESFFRLAHYDEKDQCKNLIETIVSAMFKKADIIDCSTANIIYKNINEDKKCG